MGALDHRRQQVAERRHRPVAVGVGQAAAVRRARAHMIQSGGVAVRAGRDLAQARRSRELAVQQRDQVALAGEAARVARCPMPFDRPVERIPRHQLQHRMKHAIVVRHGVALLMSGDVAKRRTPSRINAVRLVQQNLCRTAVGQARP
jgi:hypothetical protein